MRLFFVLLFVGMFTTFSASAQDAPACGMEATMDGEVVEAFNSEICEDDLAYQIQNILYHKVFQDPVWRPVVELFVDEEVLDSEFNTFVANRINIGSPIYSILSGLATVAFIIFVPLLSFKVWQIGILIKKSGEFKVTEEKGDSVKLTSYFLFIVFMMVPTGSVLLSQGVAIVASLPAIKGANYIHSGYLNTVSLGAADVRLENEDVFHDAQYFASELVGIELCQQRTRKLIFATNAKQGSKFMTSGGIANLLGLTRDQDDFYDQYDSCLSYVGVTLPLPEGEGIGNIAFNKKSTYDMYCAKNRDYQYYDDAYGYDHSCGNISYRYPTNYEEIEEWDIEDELESIQSTYRTDKFYPNFKLSTRADIESVIKNRDISVDEKIAKLEEIYKNYGVSVLAESMKSYGGLDEPNKEILSIKYLYAMNSLLGGSSLRSSFSDALREYGFRYEDDRYWGADFELDDLRLGVDYLLMDARSAAKDVQAYHCASEWKEYSRLRVFIASFNTADEDDLAELLTSAKIDADCMEFVEKSQRGGGPFDKYLTYSTEYALVFEDVEAPTGGTVKNVNIDPERKNQIIEKMRLDIAYEYYKEALIKKAMIEGYIYAVRVGVSSAMSDELTENASNDKLMGKARGMGFASLGSMLMAISRNEGGGSEFKHLLAKSAGIQAEGDGEYYLNTGAFGEISETRKTEILESVNPLVTGQIFGLGHGAIKPMFGGDYYNETLQEQESMDTVAGWMEGAFFGPINHIKKASGIPSSMSLSQGLESCLEGNSEHCVSSGTHPMVGLMRFGHDLMSNMLMLAITDIVVQGLQGAGQMALEGGLVDECGDDKKCKEKKGKRTFTAKKIKDTIKKIGKKAIKLLGGPIIKVILVIIDVVATIFDVIRPIIWGLFMVGVFFAYVVPMMSFLLTMMVYLLWVASIFVVAAVIPFYFLLKLKDIEHSYKNGFNEFYETFVGPYFKPVFITISLVFAWTFVWVSLFVTNTLFGLVFEGISPESGWSLSGMVMKLLIYVVYFVVMFVMFKTSLDMIKTLPDMFASMLKLKGSKDEQYIQSLGFEQFVQTSIMRQMMEGPLRGIQAKLEKAQQEKISKAEEDRKLKVMEALVAAYENDPQGMARAAEQQKMPDDIDPEVPTGTRSKRSSNDTPSASSDKPQGDKPSPDNSGGDAT